MYIRMLYSIFSPKTPEIDQLSSSFLQLNVATESNL